MLMGGEDRAPRFQERSPTIMLPGGRRNANAASGRHNAAAFRPVAGVAGGTDGTLRSTRYCRVSNPLIPWHRRPCVE